MRGAAFHVVIKKISNATQEEEDLVAVVAKQSPPCSSHRTARFISQKKQFFMDTMCSVDRKSYRHGHSRP